ncbi:toxin-antitoxin system YwqK family antitoxin [Pedobacter sp. L105]|uniref:toxin-antitoxin system YwqK family antitoxin n=1 Tax=Pedobacter sp. L105 TaxID=1641871 RepID=UPI00131DFBD1|nr:hypothetical protein [Pedobacter sp. L105]
MSRLQQYFLQIFLPCILFSGVASAQQSYVDKFLNHEITITYDDHKVVAHVKPAEDVSVTSDRHYYWFAGNKINITQGGYSEKLLNGEYQDFYQNKNLKEAGDFDKGLKSGIWKNWTEDGVLKDQFSFSKGKKNGAYFLFDVQGRVTEKGGYQNDLLNGKQERFRADSTVVLYYKEGKIIHRKSFLPKLPKLPKFMQKVFPPKAASPKQPIQP